MQDHFGRIYELETNQPIFYGRNSKSHYSLDEVESETYGDYSYFEQ